MKRLLAMIGAATLGGFTTVGRIALFTASTFRHLATQPFYGREFGQALFQIGFLSLPVVGLTALFTGGALALQIWS